MACISVVFLMLMFVRCLQGAENIFLFDSPEMIERCPNQPKDVLDFEDIFDLSEATREMDNDIIKVTGNITVKWKLDLTDRIVVHISGYHWEVGVWQPTIFNLAYKDFCKVLYDPKEYFYTYLTQYVTNADEVKDKCVNVPGTKWLFTPFEIYFSLKATGTKISGRYKAEFIVEIFDKFNKKLPIRACFITTGEFVKG